ncbi:MAG TPA: serine/threonine-protein kinase, partial [Ktedonobacteraceae bacterium]|nr:serine/threonine-protein kinase [Ktedonobacteraceae bacterium]
PVRTVAVKVVMPPEDADADDRRVYFERFQREADTVARLEHKNILPVFEYDEAVVMGERLAYLVMPFVRGGTLRERIDEMQRTRQQFDLNTIANYISQIADALTYAHSLGVIHRDVKPANLLFHSDGRLLLSDFGIVRLSAMPALTTVGNFLGTAEYASPEQASGSELDARSDIYALGCILFELLTGHVPFSGSNPFAILSKHISDPVPSIKNMRPDLSPAIEFVVKKALAKNPQDRYQNATEMTADLQAAISPALAVPGKMRLSGDANNEDSTVAERSWQPPLPQGAVMQARQPAAYPSYPPNSPAAPASPPGAMPAQAGQWNWPAQSGNAPQNGGGIPFTVQAALEDGKGSTEPTPKRGRRLYFYSTVGIAIFLQLPTLALLFASATPGTITPAVAGVLCGTVVNLLIMAAIGFVGVTRHRPIDSNIKRFLVVSLAAALVAGLFISFGADTSSHGLYIPLLAYAVLLVSNIYGLRLLGAVDAHYDVIEVAPVLWRATMIAALTGLLPLTLILILMLSIPSPLILTQPQLLRVFGIFLVALIGAPTPGAVLALWLSRKMTFPMLLRNSAIAGLLMFAGAYILALFWSALTSNHTLFFEAFKQPGLAFLIGGCALALLGALRGMLDVWAYQRITKKKIQ